MKAFLLAVALLAAAACSSAPAATPSPTPSASPSGPLLTLTMRGGMCAPGLCETTYYVEHDGRIHLAAKPPNELGYVGEQELADLQAAISAADFDEIRSHPFAGTCPTAYDGQEMVLEFASPTGSQSIASCEVALDWNAPLFSAVAVALWPLVGQLTQP
jgi:hypothetical protein